MKKNMTEKELIETYKDYQAIHCKDKLLTNLRLREQFVDSGFLSFEEVFHIFRDDCSIFDKRLLVQDKNFVSFLMKEKTQHNFNAFIDWISERNWLKLFLWSKSFFEHFIEIDESTKLERMQYILNKIKTAHEIEHLFDNNKLFEESLKNYMLKQDRIEQFGSNFFTVAKNRYEDTVFLRSYQITEEDAKRVVELIDLYEKMSNFKQFSHNQQKQIFDAVQEHHQSRENFLTVISNGLANTYNDFDAFFEVLTKDNLGKKKKRKLNF